MKDLFAVARTWCRFVEAAKMIIAPDCGLKYLPREVAFGKMKALVDGAKIVRAELG
jgi:5-methyltetrahydropteroyltriglutamate--homocysteine methyltransferase